MRSEALIVWPTVAVNFEHVRGQARHEHEVAERTMVPRSALAPEVRGQLRRLIAKRGVEGGDGRRGSLAVDAEGVRSSPYPSAALDTGQTLGFTPNLRRTCGKHVSSA